MKKKNHPSSQVAWETRVYEDCLISNNSHVSFVDSSQNLLLCLPGSVVPILSTSRGQKNIGWLKMLLSLPKESTWNYRQLEQPWILKTQLATTIIFFFLQRKQGWQGGCEASFSNGKCKDFSFFQSGPRSILELIFMVPSKCYWYVIIN